jgi:hypothetical protein
MRMTIDVDAATSFMATQARTLDRRRFELLTAGDDSGRSPVLAAVDGYRNPDGGYGWGLEPDLRSPESQPGGALHAFEAIADAAPATTPHAKELCDWLSAATLPDGGLPFALPVTEPTGVAPFWAKADPNASSLQITAYVATAAHRVAAHDPKVAEHPWRTQATDYCLAATDTLGDDPHALVLVAALGLVDAVHDTHPGAPAALERLARHVPHDGMLHVGGGAEDEYMRPLDFAPSPGRPSRALIDAQAAEKDLERLASGQQDDGGWVVDFQSYSPAATLEWRGYTTVRAVATLRRNGAL